jgi:hypothetical protein
MSGDGRRPLINTPAILTRSASLLAAPVAVQGAGATLILCAALLAPWGAYGAGRVSLDPPRHIGAPLPQHAATQRAFQGIPSMAVAPGGRLWANWYAGMTPAEDRNNYVVLATSGDGGATWREVLVVDPDDDGPVRAFDPELWVSPDGRLFVFWAQMEEKMRDSEHGV